ncbi:MAG: M1 family aminopeptidase [Planctomycetaceae bacterium]
MLPALLLLFASLDGVAAQALLRWMHGYDILDYRIEAEAQPAGLAVRCRLRLRTEREGPLRFFFSTGAKELRVSREGTAVEARLGAGEQEALVRRLLPAAGLAPTLLTLTPDPPLAAGEEATFDLAYLWSPPAGAFAYAGEGGVQTHLSGWWVPMMADELFHAEITVRAPAGLATIASGLRVGEVDGVARFRSEHPLQVLALVVGPLVAQRRTAGGRTLEAWLPAGFEQEGEGLLDDLAAVLALLEEWFGPAPGTCLSLVVEPRRSFAPSYCAGSFLLLQRHEWKSLDRPRRLRLLAHECAHIWWGHRVPSSVVGGGGTWIREGLAEWSGIRVAGTLLGEEAQRALFRDAVRAYFERVDLREAAARDGGLVAREPSLVEATYLDPPRVPYFRGALVFRALEGLMGEAPLRAGLRRVAEQRAFLSTGIDEFTRLLGGEQAEWAVAYYARSTRLPDFVLEGVEAREGSATGRVRCQDRSWRGGLVPCIVETDRGIARFDVEVREGGGELRWSGEGFPSRLEVDPERVYLDPLRANNVWPR